MGKITVYYGALANTNPHSHGIARVPLVNLDNAMWKRVAARIKAEPGALSKIRVQDLYVATRAVNGHRLALATIRTLVRAIALAGGFEITLSRSDQPTLVTFHGIISWPQGCHTLDTTAQ